MRCVANKNEKKEVLSSSPFDGFGSLKASFVVESRRKPLTCRICKFTSSNDEKGLYDHVVRSHFQPRITWKGCIVKKIPKALLREIRDMNKATKDKKKKAKRPSPKRNKKAPAPTTRPRRRTEEKNSLDSSSLASASDRETSKEELPRLLEDIKEERKVCEEEALVVAKKEKEVDTLDNGPWDPVCVGDDLPPYLSQMRPIWALVFPEGIKLEKKVAEQLKTVKPEMIERIERWHNSKELEIKREQFNKRPSSEVKVTQEIDPLLLDPLAPNQSSEEDKPWPGPNSLEAGGGGGSIGCSGISPPVVGGVDKKGKGDEEVGAKKKEKSFLCYLCAKEYNHKSSLNRHLEAKHYS